MPPAPPPPPHGSESVLSGASGVGAKPVAAAADAVVLAASAASAAARDDPSGPPAPLEATADALPPSSRQSPSDAEADAADAAVAVAKPTSDDAADMSPLLEVPGPPDACVVRAADDVAGAAPSDVSGCWLVDESASAPRRAPASSPPAPAPLSPGGRSFASLSSSARPAAARSSVDAGGRRSPPAGTVGAAHESETDASPASAEPLLGGGPVGCGPV